MSKSRRSGKLLTTTTTTTTTTLNKRRETLSQFAVIENQECTNDGECSTV